MNICNLPPILTDFATPAPPETTKPPVVADIELSVELNVALPVAAPIDITVAAPKALIVVAVALNKANVPEPVVTLVVKSGEVANTKAPLPVSPVIVFKSSNDVVAAKSDNLLLVVANVPVVGKVKLVVAVVLNVRLWPPEVINEEPLAKVNVALVAGAVSVSLLMLVAVATPSVGVTKVGVLANTKAPLPVSSDIRPNNSNDVVAAKSDNLLLVVANVPVVGKVKLVVAVVLNVRLWPPEVINEDPLANVNVALVAGAVSVSLLYVVAETFPFASITPDTDDEEPVDVYKLPPIPTPPVIFSAPVVVDIEVVESDTVKAELNVLAPARVCVPVDTTPLALDPASGKLNV